MSVKTRLHAILPHEEGLKRCIITGGSSTNEAFQQVCADVLHLPVYVADASGSATVGGALLARWGWYKATGYQGASPDVPFEETREGGGVSVRLVAEPHPEAVAVYNGLADMYEQNEAAVIKVCRERDAAKVQAAPASEAQTTESPAQSTSGLLGSLLQSLGFTIS
ncbi:hypothetical protein FRC08_016072 [Ceratobasidium sp. 394]|nr:hypothetical protein FRC08_016072 [Ceratobasidium sp. 394]